MTAMGSGSSARPIVHLESNGGTRTAHFAGEVTDSPTKKGVEKRDDLADTWQIDSKILQCKMRHGQPVRLGKGGNGSVFLGLLLGTTDVAIKVVERPTAKEQQRFEREIDLLRACYHPNVIRFLGANIRPEKTFLVMEFCPGGDLFNAIQNDKEGQFRWGKRGLGIALDIARGLTYLHSRSIIHLDIKSPNVLLTRGLEAKVSDIGLGKVIVPGGDATGPEGASYWWSSPEQLFGYACTSASDIFSLGTVLWELCTGEAPVDRHLRDILVPDEASQEVVDLINSCRNAKPTMRPTAGEVHAAIRRETY